MEGFCLRVGLGLDASDLPLVKGVGAGQSHVLGQPSELGAHPPRGWQMRTCRLPTEPQAPSAQVGTIKRGCRNIGASPSWLWLPGVVSP